MQQLENKAANRTSGIGGSDIASILNLPPYGCARRLFYQKKGATPDYPLVTDDGPIQRGNMLEPLILEKYEAQTGRSVVETDEFRDSEHPYLMAHPDALAVWPNARLGIVEAKSPGAFVLRDFQRKGLSEGYILQMQWYLGISGLRAGAYAVLDLDSWKVRSFDVEPDDKVFASAKEQAIDFWEKVQRDDEPPRLDPKCRQCEKCEFRTSCQGEALLQIAGTVPDGEVQERPDLVQILAQYVDARDLAAQADAYLEDVKAEFQALMGEACQAADIPGARIYWRPQQSMRLDSKALDKALREEASLLKIIAAKLSVASRQSMQDVTADDLQAELEDTAQRLAQLQEACKKPSVSRPFRYYPR